MRDFNWLDRFIQRQRTKLIDRYVPADSVVLDIGCGFYPHNLINLQPKIKRGVGLDKDIPGPALSNKLSFIRTAIVDALPFPEMEFDCVLLLAVLEHLTEPVAVIKECRRVLQPGGRLIITIPNDRSKPLLLTLAWLGLISREEVYDHKHYFRQQELAALLLEAGFQQIISRSYNLGLASLFVFKK